MIAKQGRKSAKVKLSERFQICIQQAAMRAGRQGSAQYLDDWRREYDQCGRELEQEALEAAEKLEANYSDERLQQLAGTKGLDLNYETRG